MTGFRKLAETVVYDGHLRVMASVFEAPDGSRFKRETLKLRGAVGVVAMDADGRVALVRQYRPALDEEILEIPAGVRDVPGEELIDTAARELREEAGLEAGELELLCSYSAAVGIMDSDLHIFLTHEPTPCATDRQGVEEEHMTVVWVPIDDVPDMIRAGTIRDGKTIAGVLMALAVTS